MSLRPPTRFKIGTPDDIQGFIEYLHNTGQLLTAVTHDTNVSNHRKYGYPLHPPYFTYLWVSPRCYDNIARQSADKQRFGEKPVPPKFVVNIRVRIGLPDDELLEDWRDPGTDMFTMSFGTDGRLVKST